MNSSPAARNGSASPKDKQVSLEAAFAYFNETSAQLARSYHALEARVHKLNVELDLEAAAKAAEHREKIALEQRLQALLDFLPGGVIVLDHRGCIVQSNPAAKKLLDCELDGRVWRHVIAESFSPRNDDGFEVSTRSGLRVSIATSSLGDEGQILLLTDQTETRKLQANLSRHEKLSAMGKMVSALAHQIRTPLSAALLYAGHLVEGKLDRPTQVTFSRKLLGRLQHMEKQVRDMLLFVKSELPLNDLVDVATLESELQQAVEVVLQNSNARCEWHDEVPTCTLKCHRDALIGALTNLINNAVQSTDDPVDIQVVFSKIISAGKDALRIVVKDNGKGMDSETLARVQEPFTTSKDQGTGLGLAVVRSIARAHGAEFTLHSNEGRGTEARLDFPLHSMTEMYKEVSNE